MEGMSSFVTYSPLRGSWLERNLLALVAVVAFLFMSALAFEQGRVIETQRRFIAQIFGDSISLNAVRAQVIVEHQRAQRQSSPETHAKP